MTTAGSLPGIQPSLLRRKLQLASRVPQASLRERKHHAALKPTISSSQPPSLPSVVNRARTYSLKATTLKWRPPEQAEHTAGCGSQRRPPPRLPVSREGSSKPKKELIPFAYDFSQSGKHFLRKSLRPPMACNSQGKGLSLPVHFQREQARRRHVQENLIFPCPQLTITQSLGLSGTAPRTGTAITSKHAAEDLGKEGDCACAQSSRPQVSPQLSRCRERLDGKCSSKAAVVKSGSSHIRLSEVKG